MGSSTVSLQDVDDFVASQGIPTPLNGASGYGIDLALKLGTHVMGDLIAQRFNWKFNRNTAPAFYTNSWQQDYPQVGLKTVGWLEDADRVLINSNSVPKPMRNLTIRRGLSRTSHAGAYPQEICWMTNGDLTFGTWAGPLKVYSPLISVQPLIQNSILNFVDANGNLLVLTTFGTTGVAQPAAPANSNEGVAVVDGSCRWAVASMDSQGFRLDVCAPGTGPTWQIIPYYQAAPVKFTKMDQLINPIPDDQARHFERGYKCYSLGASPNPGDRAKFDESHRQWMTDMAAIRSEADGEPNVYGLLPETSIVEPRFGYGRGRRDASSGAN